MKIEIKKILDHNMDYFLSLNIEYDSEPENIQNYMQRNFGNMSNILKAEFESHRDLYELVDEKFLNNERYGEDFYTEDEVYDEIEKSNFKKSYKDKYGEYYY